MNDIDKQPKRQDDEQEHDVGEAMTEDDRREAQSTLSDDNSDTLPSDQKNDAPETLDLAGLVVSLLFYKGEPESFHSLARVLGCHESEIREAVPSASERLSTTGLSLVCTDSTIELRSSAAASDMILALRKDELSRDLGNAGAETLAIVLYRSPVSRAEIDHIRGVNSSFILRALMMRGLVERIDDPDNKRTFRYRPTTETLAHLGVTDITNLPDHHVVSSELTAFFKSHQGS